MTRATTCPTCQASESSAWTGLLAAADTSNGGLKCPFSPVLHGVVRLAKPGTERQTQAGGAGWPDFDPDFAEVPGLIEPYLSLLFADDDQGSLDILAIQETAGIIGDAGFPGQLEDFDRLLPVVGGHRVGAVGASDGDTRVHVEVDQAAVVQQNLRVPVAVSPKQLLARRIERVGDLRAGSPVRIPG